VATKFSLSEGAGLKNFAKCVAAPANVQLVVAAALLMIGIVSASAQTLTGTVTNGTTGKPAAGDEIILINLSSGMEVAANTKADSAGKFSFTLKDGPGGPHLIRAVHQGVTYHQMAPPGVSNVEMNVYDVAKSVPGIQVTADVMRFQAESGTLQGIRLFAVNNASSPAKTQMNDHNFEFYLPPGAKIEQAQAKAPGGQPIAADVSPQAEKNRYAVVFPLRPGETQFQIEYTMPYSGEIKIDPKLLAPAEHMVVVLPKSIQFSAQDASTFQSMQDPGEADTMVEVVQQAHPGQQLGFTLKGTGTITESSQQVAAGAAQRQQGMSNGPGGGLGTPIGTPDPLQQYRWYILGGFALVLAAGGWYVTKQRPSAATSPANAPAAPPSAPAAKSAKGKAPVTPAVAAATPATKASMLLEALKEEMFQLEMERRQGKVTQAEYEKAKAALDQTLDRALKRQ
jgi:hypothetical protein